MELILSTPIWVWAIFCYIIFVGIKAMKPKIVPVHILFIVPVILISLKHNILTNLDSFLVYITFLFIGGIIGFLLINRLEVKVFPHNNSVECRGDKSVLIILLIFFFIKYFFGFFESTYPQEYDAYQWIDHGISGLLSGYFLGKSACYTYKLYKK